MKIKIHVSPNNDKHEHDLDGGLCPCLPREKHFADSIVVVHNSYDKREVGTVMRKALDVLGCAMADASLVWTDEQREAYEHAIHPTHLHWPKDG